MIEAIDTVRVKGDSVGGVVTCIARNVPRVIDLSDFLAFVIIYIILSDDLQYSSLSWIN